MAIVLVTGSAGLVGSAAVELFAGNGFEPVGIDNDMRRLFFGEDASTSRSLRALTDRVSRYRHHDVDIRDRGQVARIFATYGSDIGCVIHAPRVPEKSTTSAAAGERIARFSRPSPAWRNCWGAGCARATSTSPAWETTFGT
jgi:nucleoside-diphosphate-sugar epimerase